MPCVFSTSGETFVGSGKPSLNARADFRLQRTAVFQRSGAPGRFRAARPVVMNSRNLLPALNEMTTVQVKGPYSVSRADGKPRHSGFGKCRTASRRDSFPPLSAAGVVQVMRPYSVSGADGTLCHAGIGKCRTRPRWPTDVPAFAVTSVLFVGISGLLREREVRSSGKTSLRADSRFLKIWRGVAGSEKPSLNAWAGLRLPRMTVSQRSGAPGDERSPAGGHE